MTEIERITRLLDKTFDKQPWYGMSVMATLGEIKSDIVKARHGATHDILELVQHMTSWRVFATKRLQGDNSYEVSADLNFPKAIEWDLALKNLKDSQVELLAAAKSFPENRLGELVPSKTHKYTYYTLLHGIIQHDVYHLGQIAYIKKSQD